MLRDYQVLGVLLASTLCLVVPATARADHSNAAWLSVDRSDNAAGCPDAAALQSATEALLDQPPDGQVRLIHVAFERSEGRFVATLRRVDSDHAGRKLRDNHADCEPLAQAVVTTLALMLETRALEAREPPPPEPAPIEPRVGVTPEPMPPPARPPRYELALGLEGGAAYGAIDAWSPFFGGQLAFGSGALRVSIGTLVIPSSKNELGPGRVEVGLTAVTTRACLRLLDSTGLDLFTCSGVFGGILSASATGYTEDFERTRPWLALPFELFLTAPLGARDSALGLRTGATLLVPARRETFSVQGLGAAVEPERVAVLLWLGFDGSLRW